MTIVTTVATAFGKVGRRIDLYNDSGQDMLDVTVDFPDRPAGWKLGPAPVQVGNLGPQESATVTTAMPDLGARTVAFGMKVCWQSDSGEIVREDLEVDLMK